MASAAAEIVVKHAKDARTGLPVYSLYGATRRPTPEMLEGLDAIVIDFQDIGSRSYTYISCMRLVIEACFSLPRPIRVIVLDRPIRSAARRSTARSSTASGAATSAPTRCLTCTASPSARSPAGRSRPPASSSSTMPRAAAAQLEVVPMRGWSPRDDVESDRPELGADLAPSSPPAGRARLRHDRPRLPARRVQPHRRRRPACHFRFLTLSGRRKAAETHRRLGQRRARA